MLVVDIEAYDPNLSKLGDGSMRKDGAAILCVGTYNGTDYKWFNPNDPLLQQLLESSEPKIFHNSIYDLSWLVCGYGYRVGGILHDTMTRATLIDEYQDLDLDSCCKRHKIQGKNADDTIEAWFNSIKKAWDLKGDVWDNADVVWMSPIGRQAMIKYNKQDCIATWNLFHAQEALLEQQREAYELECALQPVILEMKKNGIRIDPVARDRLTTIVNAELNDIEKQLFIGFNITRTVLASPKKMTFAMHQLGIYSPVLTPTGGESWSADALELIEHPAIELIQRAKVRQALLSKYLQGSMVESIIDGRIHCTFSPNKRDTGGTITGRLSSSKPNLQNIPARESKHGQESYGQEMRSLFLPEEGCMLAACDYSQIEYLLLAHYAQGRQAEWFREQANAGVDFHTVAMNVTGIDNRDQVKRLNYGIIYGMGVRKMYAINRKTFGSLANTQIIFDKYHAGLPVIHDTMYSIQNETKMVGYVTSIGGRVHHKPRPQLIDGRWNDLIYKMTNYRIQGAAADILKRGLVDSWNAGVFSELKLHLTVHDENVVSVRPTKAGVEALIEMNSCMENAYKDRLLVPMKVVCEVGPNWGYWKDDVWKQWRQAYAA